MYRKFYHLRKAPFQMTVDPDFFWTGEKYARALEAMRYGLEHRGGLTLLTGESGTGKTAVVQALFRLVEEQQVLSGMIPDPCRTEAEFFNLVLAALGIPARVEKRQAFHAHLRSLLEETGGQGRQVLLVIDEAQRLSSGVVREIDAMLDLPPGPAGGLSICLVGRLHDSRELMELIAGIFSEKVTVTYRITPLTEQETASYIRHRLAVAEAGRDIFTEEALHEVHRCTKGYPGLINGLCDFAMFSAHNMGLAEIGAEVVLRSGASLRLAGVAEASETAAQDAAAGSVGNSTAPAGGNSAGQCDPEHAAGENVPATAAEDGEQEAARSRAGEPAGMPEPSVRRGRFAVISSFGALAAVVLLVGGALYYRHTTDTAWMPPAEPPSAGPPSLAEAPEPPADQVISTAETVSTASGRDLRETVLAAKPVESRDSPPSPPAPPASSATEGAPATMQPVVAAPGVTEGPEKDAPANPPAAASVRTAGSDAKAPPAAGSAAREIVSGDSATGPEPMAGERGPAPVPAATAPISGPAPEEQQPSRSAESLSPALKALLAGGTLAGDPAVRRLPDVRVNSSPGRTPRPEARRGDGDPDPTEVIDWLLKKKSGRDTSR